MNNDTTPTKICTKCGQEFPATTEYFHKSKRGKYGLRADCKQCQSIPQPPKPQPQEGYKICTQCGVEKPANTEYFNRHTNGLHPWCKECTKAYSIQYRQENQEKVKEAKRIYHQKNRDKIYRKVRKWQAENREHSIEYFKKYNDEYRRRNLDKFALAESRRRARLRSLPDTFTHEQWIACLKYFNYCCAVCGNQLRDLFGDVVPHADHWIPVSYEGNDNPGTTADNMVCLCNDCNHSKSAKLPHEWLKQKFGTRKANEILARIQAYFDSLAT